MASRRIIVLGLLAFFLAAQPLSACSIPVFRFALERWAPDLFEVSVFFRGTLSDSDERRVTQFEDWAVRNGGHLNLEVVRCNLEEEVPADLLAIWTSMKNAPLPTVVVRTPHKATGQTIVWSGRLSDPFLDTLPASPARREILQRLLQGDSVVWLFARGGDAAQAKIARQTLDTALEQVAEQVELPAGIGRPGSELLARIPLRLKFSVVEVSAEARDELVLSQLLRSALSKPLRDGDSLIAPIFGRGRVLAVQSARELEPETITDLTTYLCSACSCQVKQQNPGFDLLGEMNWDERLFGEATELSGIDSSEPRRLAGVAQEDVAPILVAIPPGHALRVTQSPSTEIDRSSPGGHASLLVFVTLLALSASLFVVLPK